MAGNSFNDFAALKALKRELEKGVSDVALSKVQNGLGKAAGGRKPKVGIREEKAGAGPDARSQVSKQGLQPGMKVTLMDSNDRGVIRHIRKDCVEIELDSGFVIPTGLHDFIVNDADEDRKLRQSVGSPKSERAAEERQVFTNKAVEIDLHVEAIPGGLGIAKGQELPHQLEYFRRTLRSRLKHRGSRIIFVHGVGDGILKAAIREELDTVYAISCSWNPYGEGATAVTIR